MSSSDRRPTLAVDARALLTAPHGIATYTAGLLEELDRRGELGITAMAHRPLPPVAGGIEVAIQPSRYGVLWQQAHVPRWLRRHRPDLFWSPLQTLPLLAPLLARETQLVTTVHDLTVLTHPAAHTSKVKWSQAPLLGRSLSIAHHIVAISAATAAEIERHFPRLDAGKITVIHNGVDAAFAPSSAPDIATWRRHLGAPEGYLLAVGTLEPRKNLAYLLDAWIPLRERGEAPPLLLAGPEGWGEEALRRRLAKLAPLGVLRLGVLDKNDLVRTVAAATAFVYPSLAEGFGLPAAEAMACGVPTLVCDISSLPEVVGDAGLLVDPSDPSSLSRALLRVLREPALAAELSKRGVERAARFTWARSAEQLSAVFARGLDRR
jgi:alpha-1,3-rhamnosyl/mannosyltransferase